MSFFSFFSFIELNWIDGKKKRTNWGNKEINRKKKYRVNKQMRRQQQQQQQRLINKLIRLIFKKKRRKNYITRTTKKKKKILKKSNLTKLYTNISFFFFFLRILAISAWLNFWKIFFPFLLFQLKKKKVISWVIDAWEMLKRGETKPNRTQNLRDKLCNFLIYSTQ